jgi:dephospho-CoA kinase
MGYPVIVMGDFVRMEAEKRGLKPNAENLGKLMLEIRKEKGEDVVAKLTVEAVKKTNSPIVFIDGVRSLKEVEEFKRNFEDFRLIAVHAPEKVRFKRVSRRLRSDDVSVMEKFKERDLRELKVGIGDVIALADRIIENIGSKEEFKSKVRKVLGEIAHEALS